MIGPDDIPGAIFWADFKESVGQEEQGGHPWIVISKPDLARKSGLIVAVPMTSNPIEYFDTEIEATSTEITSRPHAKRPLRRLVQSGVIKCAKIRHWSVERVGEVVGKASPMLVSRIRGVVADLTSAPTYGGNLPRRPRSTKGGR